MSYHARLLHRAGLLERRKRGRKVKFELLFEPARVARAQIRSLVHRMRLESHLQAIIDGPTTLAEILEHPAVRRSSSASRKETLHALQELVALGLVDEEADRFLPSPLAFEVGDES